MSRSLLWITLILTMILCWSSFAQELSTVTIATFNIQHFGETDNPHRIAHLATICQDIDLLAIQEVHPDGADAVARLASALGDSYQWVVSDETTWERFAFIWRQPVTLLKGPVLLDKPKLGRKPFAATFKAGNFDFEIVNIHLFWDGSKKTYPHTRAVEFKLLDDWLSYREDLELDLLLVGDFNAPGVYYGYQFPPVLSPSYFFYEFLNRHELLSVTIDKGIPTSIMNRSIYDHIIFNPSRYFVQEFAGIESVEVVRWDRKWDLNQNGVLEWDEYEIARKGVSDHRLVKASFRIDLPDDDDLSASVGVDQDAVDEP